MRFHLMFDGKGANMDMDTNSATTGAAANQPTALFQTAAGMPEALNRWLFQGACLLQKRDRRHLSRPANGEASLLL